MDADTATESLTVLLAGSADWQAATAMRLTEGPRDVTVDTATDASGCLAALATAPHPDAVVVAPELPDGDGVALCEQVRERYDLPAVLYAEDGTAAGRAREAGLPVVEGGDGDLLGRLAATTLDRRDDDDHDHLRAFVEAVEQSGHSIYVTDREGTIEYVNPTFEETTGYSRAEAVGRNPRILQSGRHDEAFYEEVWDTILGGEVWEGDIVNQAKDGHEYHVHQTIAPITDEDGAVRRFVAVNADITERRRREREIGRQRDLLDRLNRVNATVWAVSQALLRARTREGIEEAVCERLADTGLYAAAWVGGYDAAAGEVTPRACSGTELPEPVSADGEETPPALRAARSGEVVLVREEDPTRARAFVALAYDGVTHGVLSVRAENSRCIGEYERTSLRELGRTVGYAVAAARTRRLLDADDVVELTLTSSDDRSPLVRAAGADARLSLSASVPGSDGRELYYLTVAGEDPAGAVERARATEGVEQARVARETGDGWLVELAVTGPSLPRALADTGAHVAGATAADGRVELRAELPPSADVRRSLQAARTAFPDLELVAKRSLERSGAGEPAGGAGLSERQRAALQAAYHGGYFDWPRASTAQELAGTMGVSDVTFHKHLRRAEKKLLEWYLG